MHEEKVLNRRPIEEGVVLEHVQNTRDGAQPYSLIYIDGVQYFSTPTEKEAEVLKWYSDNRKSILEGIRG